MFFIGNKSPESQRDVSTDYPFLALPVKQQVQQLSNAINEKQFVIYLQPKINLSNWKIQGAEILLRWLHPEFGLLLPEQFFAPLEQSGLLEKIGAWQVRKACQLNLFWQKCSLKTLCMAINVSCSQLMDDKFLTAIEQTIQQTGIDPACIELEISDGCLFDNVDEQRNVFENIRSKGIRLALKYSISGLPVTIDFNSLPIDAINIDKELTQQISNNRENRQIMSTILAFAHQHSLEVIAEGVETAEQLIFLNAMHCSAAQGFLLNPPLSTEKFTELYQSGKRYNHLIDKLSRYW